MSVVAVVAKPLWVLRLMNPGAPRAFGASHAALAWSGSLSQNSGCSAKSGRCGLSRLRALGRWRRWARRARCGPRTAGIGAFKAGSRAGCAGRRVHKLWNAGGIRQAKRRPGGHLNLAAGAIHDHSPRIHPDCHGGIGRALIHAKIRAAYTQGSGWCLKPKTLGLLFAEKPGGDPYCALGKLKANRSWGSLAAVALHHKVRIWPHCHHSVIGHTQFDPAITASTQAITLAQHSAFLNRCGQKTGAAQARIAPGLHDRPCLVSSRTGLGKRQPAPYKKRKKTNPEADTK
jgi:hypothetical protein